MQTKLLPTNVNISSVFAVNFTGVLGYRTLLKSQRKEQGDMNMLVVRFLYSRLFIGASHRPKHRVSSHP